MLPLPLPRLWQLARRLGCMLGLAGQLASCQSNTPTTAQPEAATAPDSVAAPVHLRPAPAGSPQAFGPAIATELVRHEAFYFVLADVTGDGRPDLVAPDANNDSLLVVPGAGQGRWQPARYYPACLSPDAVAAADLNGDGRADIAVGGYEADNVAVLLSQPGGKFAPPAYYPAEHTQAVALADVTGDNRPDLVAAGTDGVLVLPGLRGGRFGPGRFSKPAPGAYGLAVADVNSDGRPDLVTATGYSVMVLLNQGRGTFGKAVEYPAPDGANALAVGDVNQDGHPDIVTANEKAGSLSVLLGLGNGVFGGRHDYPAGPDPRSLALADVTGDGYPDLLTESYDGRAVLLLANLGNGRFGPPWATELGSEPYAVAVGDVTGDGLLDVVAVRNDIAVLPGRLRAGRAAHPKPASAALSTRVTITSISPAGGAPGTPLTLSGTNLGGATSVAFAGPAPPQTTDLSVSDDGTTLTGLFVPEGAATGPLMVRTPAGPATSPMPLVVPPTMRLASHQPAAFAKAVAPRLRQLTLVFDQPPVAASLAGIIVTGSQYGGRHQLGPATVSGTTAVLPLLGRPFGPGERVRVSLPATVQAANGAAATPYVFEFTTAVVPGSGRFGPATTYAVDREPASVAVADVTGDGRPDLLTVNADQSRHHGDGGDGSEDGLLSQLIQLLFGKRKPQPTDVGSLTVWAGQPDGRFADRHNYPLGTFPEGLTLADLDGDGRLDILTAESDLMGNSYQTAMLLSRTTGFERPIVRLLPAGHFLGAVDADGDGLPDLFRAGGKWQVYQPETPRYGEPLNDFRAGRRLDLADYITDLPLADLTGDGRLDIIETKKDQGSLADQPKLVTRLRPGLPGGRFGPALSSREVRREPAVGDVTGDGLPDLVEADAHGVRVYPGSATGFGPSLPLSAAPAAEPRAPLLADMNGDGLLDLVAIIYDDTQFAAPTGAVVVYLGQRGGRFGRPTRYNLGDQAPDHVTVADVNADGRLDIVTVSRYTSAVAVLLGLP